MNINHTIMLVLNKLSKYIHNKFRINDEYYKRTDEEINTITCGINVCNDSRILDITYYESYAYYAYIVEDYIDYDNYIIYVYYVLNSKRKIKIQEIYENGQLSSCIISSNIVKLKPKLSVFRT